MPVNDFGYAQRVETEDEYARREAETYLANRGMRLEGRSNTWYWNNELKSIRGSSVASKDAAIISAFVHLVHTNSNKL